MRTLQLHGLCMHDIIGAADCEAGESFVFAVYTITGSFPCMVNACIASRNQFLCQTVKLYSTLIKCRQTFRPVSSHCEL